MTNEEVMNMIYKICDNVQYEINENKIVIVFEKQDHKIQNFFRRLKVKIPLYKRIEFDEYCSKVFSQIDGVKTVKEIGETLEFSFGEKVHPLYERLLVFLNHIDVNCKYIERVH